jgi:hypothetical protein
MIKTYHDIDKLVQARGFGKSLVLLANATNSTEHQLSQVNCAMLQVVWLPFFLPYNLGREGVVIIVPSKPGMQILKPWCLLRNNCIDRVACPYEMLVCTYETI